MKIIVKQTPFGKKATLYWWIIPISWFTVNHSNMNINFAVEMGKWISKHKIQSNQIFYK